MLFSMQLGCRFNSKSLGGVQLSQIDNKHLYLPS